MYKVETTIYKGKREETESGFVVKVIRAKLADYP